MSMKEHISRKLQSSIRLSHVEVINESHLHNVPPGSESHFKVILVSDEFIGKMPVKRHQLVYGILANEIRQDIHALALHTYTESEWHDRLKKAPDTPDCKGGSNH
ncbi:BolA/IbaG family iron-sulfur metabolism protein [Endozoicomonas sp. Mp262]|uniref:BolA family protein n=1 Tax=Endozoicomonas sp. Mp262 TaxID=2919499 RepID=UPI0021D95CD1